MKKNIFLGLQRQKRPLQLKKELYTLTYLDALNSGNVLTFSECFTDIFSAFFQRSSADSVRKQSLWMS